jgi:hypothetical protein
MISARLTILSRLNTRNTKSQTISFLEPELHVDIMRFCRRTRARRTLPRADEHRVSAFSSTGVVRLELNSYGIKGPAFRIFEPSLDSLRAY